jgi:hypothetical protein
MEGREAHLSFRTIGREIHEHAHAAHAIVLRPGRERPRCRAAAEQRDEIAPSHVLLSTRGLQPITMPRCASQQTRAADVSDGSKPVLGRPLADVRITPESGR